MKTYPEEKERIQILVDVDIWHDSIEARRYAIADAKENVCAVSNLWVAQPKRAKLLSSPNSADQPRAENNAQATGPTL